MATHSSIPAWRIPWTEKPGGLQSVGLQKSQAWLKRLSMHVGSCCHTGGTCGLEPPAESERQNSGCSQHYLCCDNCSLVSTEAESRSHWRKLKRAIYRGPCLQATLPVWVPRAHLLSLKPSLLSRGLRVVHINFSKPHKHILGQVQLLPLLHEWSAASFFFFNLKFFLILKKILKIFWLKHTGS